MERRDPPPVRRTKENTKNARRLAELKENPGEWFLVGSFSGRGSTTTVRDGILRLDPEAMVEVTSRSTDDGLYIYARYLGQR